MKTAKHRQRRDQRLRHGISESLISPGKKEGNGNEKGVIKPTESISGRLEGESHIFRRSIEGPLLQFVDKVLGARRFGFEFVIFLVEANMYRD